jgi:hypothetical protein
MNIDIYKYYDENCNFQNSKKMLGNIDDWFREIEYLLYFYFIKISNNISIFYFYNCKPSAPDVRKEKCLNYKSTELIQMVKVVTYNCKF